MTSKDRIQLWRTWSTVALLNAVGVSIPISVKLFPMVVAYIFTPLTLWLVVGLPLQIALAFFMIIYTRERALDPSCVGAPDSMPLLPTEKRKLMVAVGITALETTFGVLYFVWLSSIEFG